MASSTSGGSWLASDHLVMWSNKESVHVVALVLIAVLSNEAATLY
jgi:hypothetical protein